MENKYCPTKEQLNVIENKSDFLIVSAGPGTGKTETLIYYLNKKLDNYKNRKKIVVCSFTRNSTNEIKKRISKTIDIDKNNYFIFSTFDAFLIKNIWKYYFGRIINFAKDNFKINCDKSQIKWDKLIVIYSKLKWKQFSENYKNENWLKNEVDRFIKNATKNIFEYGFVAEHLLFIFMKKNKEIQNYIKYNFERIIIDEAQDLSWNRYKILIWIYRNLAIKITLIGDQRQTLYTFLGAEKEIFTKLIKLDFLNIKLLELNKNWRYQNGNEKNMDTNILKMLNSKNENELKNNIKLIIGKIKKIEINHLKVCLDKISDDENALILFETNKEIKNFISKNKFSGNKYGYTFKIENNINYNDRIFIENLFVYKLLRDGKIKKNKLNNDPIKDICDYLWPYDAKANDKFLKLFWKNNVDFIEIIKKIEKDKKINIQAIWKIFEENNNFISILPLKQIHLMTIHNSKGLESHYIFIKEKILNDFIDSTQSKIEFENIYVALSRFKNKMFLF